jgi:formate hydrogenlyase subunit 6/NADH:ubiquinone oxidoreductase subunit I
MAVKRPADIGDTIAIRRGSLGSLFEALKASGYTLVGPQVKDSAIVYDRLDVPADLPQGYVTEQAPGRFRLVKTSHSRFFDFIPGAASWKQFLFPPRLELFAARRNGKGWKVEGSSGDATAYAFVGVRPCELAAIQMQDKVFLRDDYTDPIYHQHREKVFILAVNCVHPAGTCFCATMRTGPRAETGYDLCLTEIDEHFLVDIGSALGMEIIMGLPSEPASAFLLGKAKAALQSAAERAGCDIDPDTCAEAILGNLDHERWDDVAKRCLSCGNCTLACPTCFCWDVTDQTNLSDTETRRERTWDSCFNPSYSYQAGGNTRPTIRSRYRQWLSHKFGSWKQQYGMLGCVGCGRCITWCPAGIDTRVEVETLQKESSQ